MLRITDDLTINASCVVSLETDQRHYMNGPGDSTLVITMDDGRQHRIRHGYGVDIYAIKKQIEAA